MVRLLCTSALSGVCSNNTQLELNKIFFMSFLYFVWAIEHEINTVDIITSSYIARAWIWIEYPHPRLPFDCRSKCMNHTWPMPSELWSARSFAVRSSLQPSRTSRFNGYIRMLFRLMPARMLSIGSSSIWWFFFCTSYDSHAAAVTFYSIILACNWCSLSVFVVAIIANTIW